MSNKSALETFKAAKEALQAEYKAKLKELAALNKQLEAVGITFDSPMDKAPSKSRKARKSYPAITVEAVKSFLGSSGKSAGELASHFGQKWSKQAKSMAKNFEVVKDGTSKHWKNK